MGELAEMYLDGTEYGFEDSDIAQAEGYAIGLYQFQLQRRYFMRTYQNAVRKTLNDDELWKEVDEIVKEAK